MNRIKDMLNGIEFKHNVKILYGCEAGSRAYDFASENSDFDIRFIYIAPFKDYLSLTRKGDTITLQEGEYDIQGWDLKKALLLAKKSNPSIYEWILSPIVYREMSPVMVQLKEMIQSDFSKKVLALHYVNMAKKNLHAWSEKKESSYLVHSVRASLMLEQVIHHDILTIQFKELIKKSRVFNSDELSLLFRLKMGEDLTEHPIILQLTTKLKNFLTASEKPLVHLSEGKVELHDLEGLFFQELGIEGESDHER
ncbi:nucleotidyltransferase domain-containing protein [Bacillus sp. LL01]|uniref:nucleotidyltransferase domain-containing protein n=1 Tax=Bacillus sp. LL01 TaxID=1665556 RepID=UPI00069DAACD|nr:nucleotidyltransferase domain-containing protein [Bacillus sp. LL01]